MGEVNEEETRLKKAYGILISGHPDISFISRDEYLNHSLRTPKLPTATDLTTPKVPPSYLSVEFSPTPANLYDVTACTYPLARSGVVTCSITKHFLLTSKVGGASRDTYEVFLGPEGCGGLGFDYQPGDSFAVIPENNSDEVNLVLDRLGLLDTADLATTFRVDPNTTKKAAVVPNHLQNGCSAREILTYAVDFRAKPKKLFLRALADCCSNSEDQRRLEELCSREGNEDYAHWYERCLTLIDLLLIFPSCEPSLGLLLEQLPRLRPRPYSFTSSPHSQSEISFMQWSSLNI